MATADPLDALAVSHGDPLDALAQQHADPLDALAKKPAAKPPPKLQVAKGTDNKPKRENPLRTIGDVLEVPMALGNAWLRDDPHLATDLAGRGHHPSIMDALARLRRGDVSGLANEYGMGTTPQLQSEASRGNRFAQTRLDHPLVNAAATFGEEWANPASIAAGAGAGKVIGLAGQGVGVARRASPFIDDTASIVEHLTTKPLSRAVNAAGDAAKRVAVPAMQAVSKLPPVALARETFSRYAPLRDRGGTEYVAGGLAAQTAPQHAQAAVVKRTAELGKGLTTAQKREVLKHSYQDEHGNPMYGGNPAVPEPKGMTLAQRGAAMRADLQADDAVQHALGIRDAEAGEMAAGGTFFPMGVFHDRPVYKPRPEPPPPPEGQVAATAAASKPFGRRGAFSSGVTKRGHKTNATILDPNVEAQLHDDFDPFRQYQNHRLETQKAIANEYARRDLEKLPLVDPKLGKPVTWTPAGAAAPEPLQARMPFHYSLETPAGPVVLGKGEEGKTALRKYVDARTMHEASAKAKADPNLIQAATVRGVPLSEVGTQRVVARNMAPFDARTSEASKAEQRLAGGLKGAKVDVRRSAARRTEQVAKAAAGLDKAQRSLLMGQDILGSALRENGTVLDALSSNVAEQRTAAKAILADLQAAQAAPTFGKVEQSEAVRGAAAAAHTAAMEAQRPYWDALAEVGGKIHPDVIFDPAKKRWTVTGEFAEIPKSLLAPMKAVPKAGAQGRASGNIDRITAIVRQTHPEITDDEVRAFFRDNPRPPRVSDFTGDARARVAQDVLARHAEGGPEAVAALRNELRDALSGVDRAKGAVEGGRAATGPLSAAIRKAQGQGELAADRLGQTSETLKGMTGTTSGEEAALQRMGALDRKQRVRMQMLREDAEKARARGEVATVYRTLRTRYYTELYDGIKSSVEKDVMSRAVPEGYTRESTLGLSSPSGREMALDDSFATFFKAGERLSADQSKNAKAMWHAMQVMNRLARASIVLFPQVHGVNNLGMHYLAEGGDPVRMAQILAGKAKFAPALEERAAKAGAYNEHAQRQFAGAMDDDAHFATQEAGELSGEIAKKWGPLSAAVKPLARTGIEADRRLYQPMNDWLFGNVEKGYALDLFDRFTRAAMKDVERLPEAERVAAMRRIDGEAAIRVRNTLGKYGDISQREQTLSRLFYFYPWMKTVIPFWVKKGIIDPKWWDAPVRGIEVSNKQQGFDDPARPFTATAGKRADGQFRRVVAPIPQRVLENVAELARAPFAFLRGDVQGAREDMAAPINYVAGHASLPLSIGLDALEAVEAGGRGHAAPWNTFVTDPNDPTDPRLQVAKKLAGRAISPFQTALRFPQDPLATAAGYATGAFAYGAKTDAQKAREHMVKALFSQDASLLRKAIEQDDARGDVLSAMLNRQKLAALLAREQQALNPPPPKPPAKTAAP